MPFIMSISKCTDELIVFQFFSHGEIFNINDSILLFTDH